MDGQRLKITTDDKCSGMYGISTIDDNAKKVTTVKGYKITAKTIKKLKSRKTYYVKVRAYNKKGKLKAYGKWSRVKKVKVR